MRGLAFAVWWLFYRQTFESPYSLPYTAVSPLTYKQREFKTQEDIWNEIDKIAEVNSRTSRSIGQDLYHLIPLFTDPNYILEEWQYEAINEYNICKNFNVTLGVLDNVPARRLDYFSIIQNEFNAIAEYENNKNGKQ